MVTLSRTTVLNAVGGLLLLYMAIRFEQFAVSLGPLEAPDCVFMGALVLLGLSMGVRAYRAGSALLGLDLRCEATESKKHVPPSIRCRDSVRNPFER